MGRGDAPTAGGPGPNPAGGAAGARFALLLAQSGGPPGGLPGPLIAADSPRPDPDRPPRARREVAHASYPSADPAAGGRPALASLVLALLAALVFATPAALPLPARAQDPAAAGKPAGDKPADAKSTMPSLPTPSRRTARPTDSQAPEAKPAEANAAEAKPAPPRPPPAQAEVPEQFKAVRAKLDAAKAELDAREKQLGHTDLTVADLTAIRDSAATVTEEIRTLVTRLDAPLEAARERLAQLGPKPKDTQESADVAQQRVEREAAVTRIDETQRLARSLVVQGDQIVDRVSNRRRESFTRDLFQRSQPLAGPGLWTKVMSDVPGTRAPSRARSPISGCCSPATAASQPAVPGPRLRDLGGAVFRPAQHRPPGRPPGRGPDRSVARHDARGLAVILLGTVPAVAGSYAVYYAAAAVTNLLPSRLLPVAAAILGGLAFIAFVEALCEGLLSPRSRRGGPPQ